MYDTWSYFRETGDLEAYLLYKEFQRLVDGEYSKEFIPELEEEEYERKNAWTHPAGNQLG